MKKDDVINKVWKPNFKATGTRVFVKINEPKDLEVGKIKFDAMTGMTSGGIIMAEEVRTDLEAINMIGQMEVEVVDVAPQAFRRDGLQDMIDTVTPGKKIVIEEFTAKPLKDNKGQRTLYYHVKEHQIIGVVE